MGWNHEVDLFEGGAVLKKQSITLERGSVNSNQGKNNCMAFR